MFKCVLWSSPTTTTKAERCGRRVLRACVCWSSSNKSQIATQPRSDPIAPPYSRISIWHTAQLDGNGWAQKCDMPTATGEGMDSILTIREVLNTRCKETQPCCYYRYKGAHRVTMQTLWAPPPLDDGYSPSSRPVLLWRSSKLNTREAMTGGKASVLSKRVSIRETGFDMGQFSPKRFRISIWATQSGRI